MLWSVLLSSVHAAEPLPPLAWDWSSPSRFLVETEVLLPMPFWAPAQRNRAVRLVGFQLQWVLDCEGDGTTRRAQDVSCRVEDFSLVAGTSRGDRGDAQRILDEYDDVVTDERVTFRLHRDGHIIRTDMPDLDGRNVRTRRRNETIKQFVRFGLVGFELPLRHEGRQQWLTERSSLCVLSTMRGNASPVEAVHHGVQRDGIVEYATNAHGLVVTGTSLNQFTCDATVRGFVDPGIGALQVRWEMVGEPTASSPIALGAAGIPFTQRGGLRRLSRTESVELNPTTEILLDRDGNLLTSAMGHAR